MRHSIIRRSLVLTAFYIAGHGFNYLLLLIANVLLDATGFGRLYTGWAILNVLLAPISIIALLLSGYFAEANSRQGPAFVAKLLERSATTALPWAAAAVILLEILFYVGGRLVGIDSLALMLMLPLTAITCLGVEMVRASLLGMLRFTAYGVSWLLWCAAQCALGVAGLWLTRSPWGCFAGVLVANLITIGGLTRAVGGRATVPAPTADGLAIAPYSPGRVVGFCSAFVGCVLCINIDIFLAYLILTPSDLGVYTASSVLPKAIVTATQPVAQIILPVVIAIQGEGRDTSAASRKAIAAAFTVGALAFCVLWGGSDLVCGAPYGIRFCTPPLLLLLAAAAVPLSVTRTLIAADVAHGRYWLPHLPFLGIAAFAASVALIRAQGPIDSLHLATTYLFFCWGLLSVWAVAGALRGRLFGRGMAPVGLHQPDQGGS